MEDCLFCMIAEGKIPSKKLYEDDQVVAFYDINPQAKVHFLVVPRKHISSAAVLTEEDGALLGHIFTVIAKLAKEQGLEKVYVHCFLDGRDVPPSSGKGYVEQLQAKIQEIMNTLRENAPAEIGGYKVTAVRDYKKDTITDTATGAVKPTGLPASNVLYYELSDNAWCCVRPSGTEPKIKFYYGIKGTSLEDADQKSAALGEEVLAMINKML